MNTSLNAYLTKSLNEGFLKTSNSSIVPDALNNIIKNHSTIHPESRILINQEENLRVIIEQPNLKIISNVKLKNKLNIKSCPNLYQIYKTESKHYLCIDECDMLTSQDQLIKSRCKNGWITIRNTKAMINNRF